VTSWPLWFSFALLIVISPSFPGEEGSSAAIAYNGRCGVSRRLADERRDAVRLLCVVVSKQKAQRPVVLIDDEKGVYDGMMAIISMQGSSRVDAILFFGRDRSGCDVP
jgi:hypothetical protein